MEPPASTTAPLAAADSGVAALITAIEEAAASADFSGHVSITRGDEVLLSRSWGLAHRALGVPVTAETRFGTASASKGFTALAVMRLVEEGLLRLDTRVREVLGADLPLIDDAVTIEHLLGHTSGIGDYLDESGDLELTDYLLTQPIHTYTSAESFLPDLAGHPQVSAPGETFAYNNGGYLVLALVAERVSGVGYHDLVRREVLAPAGLTRTDYLRSDRLPADVAVGYLEASGDWSNVLHLPVLGGGDGGAYTTAGDLALLWRALDAGAVVRPETYALMTAARHDVPDEGLRNALGFWVREGSDAVVLEGCDAGVSLRSTHDPVTGLTASVLCNTADAGWPVIGAVDAVFETPVLE